MRLWKKDMLYLFVIGRILFGGFFIVSGLNHFMNLNALAGYAQSKGTPMAKEAVMLSGAMILLGGVGVVLGIYIQLSVILISAFLLVISFQMHPFWKETDAMGKMSDEINFKKNMALMGAALMLLMIPASSWAFPLMM